jgi:hypothetical protein
MQAKCVIYLHYKTFMFWPNCIVVDLTEHALLVQSLYWQGNKIAALWAGQKKF